MKRRLAVPLLLAALLAAAGWGGWRWWTELRFLESTDNAYVQADLTVVSPRVEGYAAAVEVADNQHVRRGDVLVRLDDRDHRARLDEAEAALRARAAAVAIVASRLRLQAALAREAEARLASARADAARAHADLERYARLVERKNASAQTLDAARAEAERTRALVAAAEAALDAARDQALVLEAEREGAEAERGVAAAARELARLALDDTAVRAPADGVVGNKAVQPGDYLKVGRQLMVLVPLDRTYVEANFKETQLGGLRVGDRVRVEVDAYPGVALQGTVESLAPASGSTFSLLPPENATGNFTKIVQRVPVRVGLPPDNPLAGRLRPGLSVVVTVDRQGGEGGAAPAGTAQAATPAAR
jgi:membrane fusion protein, multidrug efflux system